MTVGELIERLNTQPSDALVILSRDAEGSGYEYANEVMLGYFSKPLNYFTDDEDRGDSWFEKRAVCIWP